MVSLTVENLVIMLESLMVYHLVKLSVRSLDSKKELQRVQMKVEKLDSQREAKMVILMDA